MAGQYTESILGRGRPLTDIPSAFVKILEATYRDDKDYILPGREDDPDATEIIRYGRIYAKRKNLSFRYMFTSEGKFRFRIADKRPYTKRNIQYWETL
jgi:hypothetical protein